MTEQLKQKYINILNQCQQFSRFQKVYNSIENHFLPKNKQNLQNLEDLTCYYTNKGKEQWQLIETSDNEVCIVLKKFDTNYNLKIFNLTTYSDKSITDISNNTAVDENCIALLEVHNLKKDMKYMLEMVVAKEADKIFLVEKDWTYLPADEKWTIQCENVQLNKNQTAEICSNI